jgi:gluconolactonase
MFDTIRSLKIEKLSPSKNPEISWCYAFLPALIGYFYLLTIFINSKPKIGRVEILKTEFNKLIYPNAAKMEIIASGSQWTEGPLWVDDEAASIGYLLYSDTRQNKILRWDEGKGLFTVGKTLHTDRSGCKSNLEHCDSLGEAGSNGLLRMNPSLMPDSTLAESRIDLLACQHGERAISLIRDNGTRTLVAAHFRGKRFNSPNDMVWSPEGNLYFTDPTYGLKLADNVTSLPRELPFNGVYMIRAEDIKEAVRSDSPTNNVVLLTNKMSMPNGLAFSPDFGKLYVTNSDRKDSYIKVFDISADDGKISNGRTFFNATELLHNGNPEDSYGHPDGIKVDIQGNVFSTGPGGVIVFSPEGEIMGRLRLDRRVSNLAFGGDGRLYLTAGDLVVRMWIKTKPTRIISSKSSKK